MTYLHGIETIPLTIGPSQVRQVRTAVLGLVVTCPMGPVNVPTLIVKEADAAQFGAEIAGFTGPEALRIALSAYKIAPIVVVNVCDPATHKTTITNELKVLDAAGVATASKKPFAAAPTVKNQAGSTTYIAGTDYTYDAQAGTVTRKSTGAIVAGATLSLSFDYVDPADVVSADVIGGVDGVTGERTGLEALRNSMTLFGFSVKLPVIPGFDSDDAVVSALASFCDAERAWGFFSAPVGTIFADMLTGRGASGTINLNTSEPRIEPVWPHLKNGSALESPAVHAACLQAWTDLRFGYWYSASNQNFRGVDGVEFPVTASLNDPNTEANMANEVGVTTVFNAFGTGLRMWGNRGASYPTETGPRCFRSVQRTADIVAESLELFSLKHLDKPTTKGRIDAIRDDGNGFINELKARGATLGGSVYLDPDNNTPESLAAGQAVFAVELMPPPPLERITYRQLVNVNLLATLIG